MDRSLLLLQLLLPLSTTAVTVKLTLPYRNKTIGNSP
jgi:hypothetical protein